MSWPPPVTLTYPARLGLTASILIFLCGYVALIMGMGLWCRLVLRRSTARDLHRRISRFNRGMFFARALVPAWLAVGIGSLGWSWFVGRTLRLDGLGVDLPGVLIGTGPCYLAWMGLWWSQYPAERAMREQSILSAFDGDLPLHAPPGFWQYFAGHFRLQILFTLVPIFLILAVVDGTALALRPLIGTLGHEAVERLQQAVILLAVGGIYLLSPEILRRVLQTQRLDDSPLRARLMKRASTQHLKVRDILLWKTHHNICNAAVMGVVGRFRYVLLTDLLIETLPDEQIEAVFAHEQGHVVHRHMQWYVLVIGILLMGLTGFERMMAERWPDAGAWRWAGLSAEVWFTIGVTILFVLGFGFLSRRFERQADVFAARTLGGDQISGDGLLIGNDGDTHDHGRDARATSHTHGREARATSALPPVTARGAGVFSAALNRVASINHIPLHSRRWNGGGAKAFASFALDRGIEQANHFLHGSIPSRTNYVQHLAEDPQRIKHFDRFMRRLYVSLLLLLIASVALAI